MFKDERRRGKHVLGREIGSSVLLNMGNLIAVLATSRSGTISGAAAELEVTQSAVTRRILKIEGAIGEPLFLRHSRGVTLTPAGRQFVSSVERAIDDILTAADYIRGSSPY
jgi:DNA-binding transcriptional LysR family regulator